MVLRHGKPPKGRKSTSLTPAQSMDSPNDYDKHLTTPGGFEASVTQQRPYGLGDRVVARQWGLSFLEQQGRRLRRRWQRGREGMQIQQRMIVHADNERVVRKNRRLPQRIRPKFKLTSGVRVATGALTRGLLSTRESESFGTRQPASGRNPGGHDRTPNDLSRN